MRTTVIPIEQTIAVQTRSFFLGETTITTTAVGRGERGWGWGEIAHSRHFSQWIMVASGLDGTQLAWRLLTFDQK